MEVGSFPLRKKPDYCLYVKETNTEKQGIYPITQQFHDSDA